MSNKLKEALQHEKNAEKALKTGLLKWAPDYDTAASEYTKAATQFKLANSPEKAKNAYIKAAELQEKLGSLFHSAKLLTQAAGILKDLKQVEDAVQMMERACGLYRENGTSDTAAMTLAKAAKMCENEFPDRASDLYLKAAELCSDDEKHHDASDHLKNAAKMLVKQKKYIKACKILEKRLATLKQIGNYSLGYQVVLCMVITYLAEGDLNAAENTYNGGFELSGFGEGDEAIYSEHFIQAFSEGDAELLAKTRSQPLVTHLDTEFARLAKSLKLDEIEISSATTSGLSELERYELTEERKQQLAPQPVVAEEPPDEDGGLC